MARVSGANMTAKDPTEWVAGEKAARKARRAITSQFADLLTSADLTGSRELVARRVADYAEAARHGDPATERAALMELAVVAGATAAGIDLRHPASI